MKRREFFTAASVGIAGLAALPRTAEASHHRVHAAGFLDDLSGALRRCQTNFDRIGELVDLSEFETLLRYISLPLLQIPKIIDEIKMILEFGTPEDLFAARRKLNHPSVEKMLEDGMGPTISFRIRQISWGFHRLEHLLEDSRDLTEEVRNKFSSGIAGATQGWESTDRAIWHVGDAIFEEYFLDAAFAEPVLPG